MGFFFSKNNSEIKKSKSKELPLEFYHNNSCKVCTLKNESIRNPRMLPTGSDKPIIYILGEAPGKTEDKEGLQFVGDSGQLLRSTLEKYFGKIPYRKLKKDSFQIRFNNCIRCHLPSNRNPSELEIECCRKSIEDDIEKTKPLIIIGIGDDITGNTPLEWMLNVSGINLWRGRKIPVKVGKHICWFFPILHPSGVMRKKKKYIETEWDRVFDRDIKNIADFIFQDEFQQPIFIDSNYEDGIELITTQTSKDLKRIEEVLNKLKKEKVTGIDVESNCLHPWDREDSKILSVAIGTEDYVISFPVEYRNVWGKKTKIVLGLLEDFILESNIKISHNLKFELIWFNWYFGQDVLRKTKWADTMAQAYVNDERTSSKKGKGMFGLDVLCLINFGFRLKKLSKVNIKDLENELLDKLLLYNGMDSKYECSLCKYQEPLIVDRLKEIYDEHIETAKTLALTESNGVEVDLDRVKVISKDLGSKIKKIENKIYNLPEVKEYEKRFGKFNPNSNPNAVKIFKDILELKWDKRTKKKKHSVDEEVIKEFASRGVKLASLILEFRPLSKLKSTYVDGIPLLLGVDGKLHTNYNAMFTATSRTSSDNPNLQNFPSRKNREVRSIIVAPKDHWFVASDYKQLEARNIAAAANERCIIESDIHGFWADYICEMNPPSAGIRYIEDLTDKILTEFRKEVKNNTVFPLFFGSVKKSLEYALGLTERQAEKLYKDFWKKYPKVKEWQERLFDFIKEYGYVEMLSGRRRRDPLSINQMYNNPIQGTGADVKIRAMNRLSKLSYKLDKPWLQPILDVHDDLSNYIPDKELEEGIEIIAKEMVRPVDFMDGIPLGVEVSVGRNWADLEVVATFEESDFY